MTYNGWANYPTWAVNLWVGELDVLDDAARAASGMKSDRMALRRYVEDILWPEDEIPPSLLSDIAGWALDEVDWDALRRHWDPLLLARERGAENGRGTASWYFDQTADENTYRRVLDAIESGDGAILDTFPFADLSGQWADTLSGPQLVEEVLGEVGISDDEDVWFLDICDAYEEAFNAAVEDGIARVARYQLGLAS